MTSKTSKSSTSSRKASKSSTAKAKGTDPDKIAERAQPLPSPLDEPQRNPAGEPGQHVGGDRSMDRGRITVPPAPAQPEVVHNRTRRQDADALTGHTVEFTGNVKDDVLGELKGKQGIFEKVDEYEKNGWPHRVIVSLHGASGRLVSVLYKDIRHVQDAVKPQRWTRSDA